MSDHYLPKGDLPRCDWTRNLAAGLLADAAGCGVSQQAAAEYAVLQASYAAALKRAGDPETATRVATADKNDVRARLIALTRRLVPVVRSATAGDAARQVSLGLPPRQTAWRQIPGPASAPLLRVEPSAGSTPGHVVTLRLINVDRAEGGSGRSRPAGVVGATLFSHAGDAPPAAEADWRFEAATTLTRVRLKLAADLPDFAPVWLTARWLGTALQPGPAAAPVQTYLLPGVRPGTATAQRPPRAAA